MIKTSIGVKYAALSYILWGIFPLYWKLLHHVSSDIVLAHRVIWAFVFMIILLFFMKKLQLLQSEMRRLIYNRRVAIGLLCSGLFVTANWGIYIYAIHTNQIVEAALGYYINPLVSILFAVVFLKERLNVLQMLAVAVATVGVSILTFGYGRFPWIAVSLAVTFALYGLFKKQTSFQPEIGLTLETLLILPFALLYALFANSGIQSFVYEGVYTSLLLMGGGAFTALPLLLFAKGAQTISLTTLGFLQYISPSISLIIGIFLFQEPFGHERMAAFSCIWFALFLFSYSNIRTLRMIKKEKTLEV